MGVATKALEFHYRKGWHLGPVDVQVPKGCVVGLVGPNGAGKTTLMRLLCGFLLPQAGEIFLNGNKAQDRYELLRRVRWVSADPAFPRGATVEDLALFTLRQAEIAGEQRTRFLKTLTELLGRKLSTLPTQLSRGQRLLLALELAFARPADALVADEPWNALDPLARERLLTRFEDLSRNGLAVLISSHDLLALPTVATRFCFLFGGKVFWQGSLEELPGGDSEGERREALMAIFRQGMGA